MRTCLKIFHLHDGFGLWSKAVQQGKWLLGKKSVTLKLTKGLGTISHICEFLEDDFSHCQLPWNPPSLCQPSICCYFCSAYSQLPVIIATWHHVWNNNSLESSGNVLSFHSCYFLLCIFSCWDLHCIGLCCISCLSFYSSNFWYECQHNNHCTSEMKEYGVFFLYKVD